MYGFVGAWCESRGCIEAELGGRRVGGGRGKEVRVVRRLRWSSALAVKGRVRAEDDDADPPLPPRPLLQTDKKREWVEWFYELCWVSFRSTLLDVRRSRDES